MYKKNPAPPSRRCRKRRPDSRADTGLRPLILFVLAAVFCLLPAAYCLLRAQQPAPNPGGSAIRAQINLVLVDVRVWDKSGHPITDLKQQDFKVLEDGSPQTVTSFSFENIERLAVATGENGPPPTIDLERLPSNLSPARAIQDHRLIVLFFDLTSMPGDDLMRALKAATEFVHKRLTPADLVAVALYSSTLRSYETSPTIATRWTRLCNPSRSASRHHSRRRARREKRARRTPTESRW